MRRKAIAGVLVFLMLLTVLPTAVFADDPTPAPITISGWATTISGSDSEFELVLDSDVTLDGVLNVPGGKTVTVKSDADAPDGGYTISRGASHTGAFFTVENGGSLTLDGVTLDGTGTADAPLVISGNGASATPGGTVIIKNSTLKNNATSSSKGGAIDIYGAALVVEGSTFSGNSSAESGGAIYVWSANTTITGDTIFTDNSAGKYGGAVYYNSNGGFSMTGGEFYHNSVTAAAAPDYSYGGAVYFVRSGGPPELFFTDVSFRENTSAGYAGAVLAQGNHITFTDCEFRENTAGLGVGAIYALASGTNNGSIIEIVDSEFIGNFSPGSSSGGAINAGAGGSTLTITGSLFEGNLNPGGRAGAIAMASSGSGALSIENSKFFNNVSGAVLAVPNSSGAIFANSSVVTHIDNNIFSGNLAGSVPMDITGVTTLREQWEALQADYDAIGSGFVWPEGNDPGGDIDAIETMITDLTKLKIDYANASSLTAADWAVLGGDPADKITQLEATCQAYLDAVQAYVDKGAALALLDQGAIDDFIDQLIRLTYTGSLPTGIAGDLQDKVTYTVTPVSHSKSANSLNLIALDAGLAIFGEIANIDASDIVVLANTVIDLDADAKVDIAQEILNNYDANNAIGSIVVTTTKSYYTGSYTLPFVGTLPTLTDPLPFTLEATYNIPNGTYLKAKDAVELEAAKQAATEKWNAIATPKGSATTDFDKDPTNNGTGDMSASKYELAVKAVKAALSSLNKAEITATAQSSETPDFATSVKAYKYTELVYVLVTDPAVALVTYGVTGSATGITADVSGNVLTVTVAADAVAGTTAAFTVSATDETVTADPDYIRYSFTDLSFTVEAIDIIAFPSGSFTANVRSDEGSDKTVDFPDAVSEYPPISYSIKVVPVEEHGRITVTNAGEIVVEQDANAGTYNFIVVATDDAGDEAELPVTLTVTNTYDDQYNTLKGQLDTLEDQLDALSTLVGATTVGDVLAALGYPLDASILDVGTITDLFDAVWNNGDPQVDKDAILAVITDTTLKTLLAGLLPDQGVSISKQDALEGVTIDSLPIVIPELAFSLIPGLQDIIDNFQITGLQGAYDTLSDLLDVLTTPNAKAGLEFFSDLTSLKLFDKYLALDFADANADAIKALDYVVDDLRGLKALVGFAEELGLTPADVADLLEGLLLGDGGLAATLETILTGAGIDEGIVDQVVTTLTGLVNFDNDDLIDEINDAITNVEKTKATLDFGGQTDLNAIIDFTKSLIDGSAVNKYEALEIDSLKDVGTLLDYLKGDVDDVRSVVQLAGLVDKALTDILGGQSASDLALNYLSGVLPDVVENLLTLADGELEQYLGDYDLAGQGIGNFVGQALGALAEADFDTTGAVVEYLGLVSDALGEIIKVYAIVDGLFVYDSDDNIIGFYYSGVLNQLEDLAGLDPGTIDAEVGAFLLTILHSAADDLANVFDNVGVDTHDVATRVNNAIHELVHATENFTEFVKQLEAIGSELSSLYDAAEGYLTESEIEEILADVWEIWGEEIEAEFWGLLESETGVTQAQISKFIQDATEALDYVREEIERISGIIAGYTPDVVKGIVTGLLQELRDYVEEAIDKAIAEGEAQLLAYLQALQDQIDDLIESVKGSSELQTLIALYNDALQLWAEAQAFIAGLPDWDALKDEIDAKFVQIRDALIEAALQELDELKAFIDKYVSDNKAALLAEIEALKAKVQGWVDGIDIDVGFSEFEELWNEEILPRLEELWADAVALGTDTWDAIDAAIRAIPNPSISTDDALTITDAADEIEYTNNYKQLFDWITGHLGIRPPVYELTSAGPFDLSKEGVLTLKSGATNADNGDYDVKITLDFDVTIPHDYYGIGDQLEELLNGLFAWSERVTVALPYTVTFVDYDGTTVLKTETVNSGGDATAPTDPTRTGYTFTGWDTPFTNVTSNLTVTAQYTAIPVTYTVTFVDYDGTTVLKTETVNSGGDATAPTDPTRTGYTFTGWDTPFTNVTGNLTVTAQYNAIPVATYTVTFVDYDGTTLDTQTVNSGDAATAPSDPTRAGYTFAGWDTPFTNVTSNLTVTAQYTAIPVATYTVTFVDYDGTTVLKTETVNSGGDATAPTDPTRTGYTFTGWDIPFTNVTGNLTVTALYNAIPVPGVGFYTVSPDTLTFGPVVYGYNPVGAQEFTLENSGTADWEGVSITLGGANPAGFQILSPDAFDLAAGETVSISVSPVDGLNAGTYSANLFITGDDGSSLTTFLTFTVSPKPVPGGAITFPAPTRGATPVTEVTIGDFTLPVVWSPALTGSTFASRTIYTAVITLPADANYDLGGLTDGSFTIPGATSVIYDPTTRTITAIFPRTAVTVSGGSGGGGGGGGATTILEEEVPLAALPSISYIYGADRVETAVAIARAGWTTAKTVILAPGDNDHIIDALSVSSLAGQDDAPILLVLNNSIRESVFTEIARLGATKAYVVGSLGQGVADQLKARFPQIEIIVLQGANRVETAKLINARITAPQGTFVVGWSAVADAVSAASFAAANGYVIQIAAQSAEFSGDASLGGYVLGGPTLVRDVSGLTRIYGSDRYGTNQGMRDSLTFMYDNVYFANGVTLVDALTGSALAAKTRAVILLTPQNDPTNLNLGPVTPETKIYGFGGPKV